jgi:hypothetical protein
VTFYEFVILLLKITVKRAFPQPIFSGPISPVRQAQTPEVSQSFSQSFIGKELLSRVSIGTTDQADPPVGS